MDKDTAARAIVTIPAANAAASRGLSLSHNFAWTLAANMVYAGCQWAAVVLLAKLGTADMVGRFALAWAVAYPIALIANLKLRDIYITDLEGKYPLADMLGARMLLSSIAFIIMLVLVGVAGYGAGTSRVILLMGVAQLIDCLSDNYFGLLQRYDRMDRIAKSLILRSVLSLAALASGIILTKNLLWGVAGFVFGRALVFIGYDATTATFQTAGIHWPTLAPAVLHKTFPACVRPHWDLRKQVDMVLTAFPLGVVTILNTFSANVPRYVIERDLGARELGIYSALNYLAAVAPMAATAFGGAAFARLSRLFFVGELGRFKLLVMKAGALCTGLGLIAFLTCLFFGRQMLAILYRPEYAQRSNLLDWLMAVGALTCLVSFIGGAMTATQQFRVQFWLFLIVTATSVIACLTLVPIGGLYGAAAAASITMTVQFVGTVCIILRGLARRARELRSQAIDRLWPALQTEL